MVLSEILQVPKKRLSVCCAAIMALAMSGCREMDNSELVAEARETYQHDVVQALPGIGDACVDRWTAFGVACADGESVCLLADDVRRCMTLALAEDANIDLGGANGFIDKSLIYCGHGGNARFYRDASGWDTPEVHQDCRWSGPYAQGQAYHFDNENDR